MRKKNKGKEIFSFSSLSTPKEFLSRLCETAVQAKLGIELTEAGFNLQLKSHHTGWYVYRASVVANESGGSIVQGTIETDLWAAGHNHSEKKKSFFQKVLTVFSFVILIPLFILVLLFVAVYMLISQLLHGKEATEKEILFDFMTNKMCCTRENDK